jgi:nitroimidazol reductase NimA-like FMN-containing flavoprotein (pyridoxamine 5'-phosphate oxidase superfamily)
MNTEELGAFLDAHRYCVLATATSVGRPLARPVAYTLVGASIWLATVAGSRLRNLRRPPWVSIVISDGDRESHRAVVIDGPATVVDQAPAEVRAAVQARQGSAADWADAWVEVQPSRLLSYSANARAHRRRPPAALSSESSDWMLVSIPPYERKRSALSPHQA